MFILGLLNNSYAKKLVKNALKALEPKLFKSLNNDVKIINNQKYDEYLCNFK